MKILQYLFISIFVIQLHAQSSIEIGKSFTIKSKFLNEDRELYISVPESYSNPNYSLSKYPVVYVLDGETNFKFIQASVEKFSSNTYPTIPEMIVVGIKSLDRYKDFTPTAQLDQKTSGNSKEFTDFLKKEVIPFVSKNYRVNDYKIVIGHSLTGLYVLDELLKNPNSFNAYVAHDPSIWWNNLEFLNDQKNNTKLLGDARVFISQVDSKNNTGRLETHYNGIQSVKNFWETHQNNVPIFKYAQYEGEDHGTVPLKGNLDALRWIFDGYEIEMRAIAKDKKLLEQSFENFSKSRNFTFLPSENYLAKVIAYLKRVKANDSLEEILTYYEKIYPLSKQLKIYKNEK